MLLSAAAIGVVAGLGAVFFRHLIEGCHFVFETVYEKCGVDSFSGSGTPTAMSYVVLFVLFAVVLFCCRWASKKFAPSAAGHGVPEIIEAVNVRGGVIQARVGVLKTLLSALTIGVGGSCGSEGPIALIGASFGSKIGQWVHVNADRLKVFTACGAAAGIAATFNAPFGGFMFAIEIVLMDFGLTKVVPIVVSTVVASATAHKFHDEVVVQVSGQRDIAHDNWLIAVLVLGIVVGLASGVYIRILDEIERIFKNEKIKWMQKSVVLMASSLFVLFVWWRPEVLGIGYETLNTFFKQDYTRIVEHFSWDVLLILFLAKILATAVTLGSGGSGGIFSPALFIGGVSGIFTGAALDSIFPSFFGGIEPTTYGIIGMGAMVSGAMRAPITGFLITYELNRVGNQNLILPLMLACVISTVMSRRIVRHGIFTINLARRGSLVVKGRDVSLTRQIKVKECFDEKYFMVTASMSFQALFRLSQAADHHSLFFVCDGVKLLGVIPMHRIRSYFSQIKEVGHLMVAEDIMVEADPVLSPEDNLEQALRLFDHSQREELPVVIEGNIKGVLTYNTAVSAYNKALHHMNLMHDLGDSIPGAENNEGVDLGDGIRIREIPVPQCFYGHCVKNLDLTGNYKVQILMIKGENQLHVTVVSGDTVLKEGQIMVLMGAEKEVEKIARL